VTELKLSTTIANFKSMQRDQLNSATGALCRKKDPKIATALKTQSRSKD